MHFQVYLIKSTINSKLYHKYIGKASLNYHIIIIKYTLRRRTIDNPIKLYISNNNN